MVNEFLLDDFMRLLGRTKNDIRSLEDGYGILELYSNDDLDKIAPNFGAKSGAELRINLEQSLGDFMNQKFSQKSSNQELKQDEEPPQEDEESTLSDLTKMIKELEGGEEEPKSEDESKPKYSISKNFNDEVSKMSDQQKLELMKKIGGFFEDDGRGGTDDEFSGKEGEGKEGEGKEGEGKEGEGKEGEGKEGEGKEGEGKGGEGKEGEGKEGEGKEGEGKEGEGKEGEGKEGEGKEGEGKEGEGKEGEGKEGEGKEGEGKESEGKEGEGKGGEGKNGGDEEEELEPLDFEDVVPLYKLGN
jgi:hypothetical protein